MSIILTVSVCFVIHFSMCLCAREQMFYAVADIKQQITIETKPHKFQIGKVNYTRSLNATGWDYLEVHTSRFPDSALQAYAAGYLEGYATADRIYLYWHNTLKDFCMNHVYACTTINNYILDNREWVLLKIKEKGGHDTYWYQVELMYKQLDGLCDGYMKGKTSKMEEISWMEFFWMNIQEDLYDLSTALNIDIAHPKPYGVGGSSALIKLLPGYKDLLVSHVTWNRYETMLRIQKRYLFRYKMNKKSNQLVFGQDITFTSYPGFIHSSDDFYLISSRLAVMKTSFQIYYKQLLWDKVSPTGQLFVFIRSMIANRIARDGLEWGKLFRPHNSGTNNNQWMIVNYALFRPYHRPPKYGLLEVVEQVPGHIEKHDVTQHLVNTTYWASYNVPAFPRIFQMTGNYYMRIVFGNWYSYEECPRARIFARDQSKVVDEHTMLNLMRSNNFKYDSESRCTTCYPPYSAVIAVSSRNDLNEITGVYSMEGLGFSYSGAIDAKMTSFSMSKTLQFVAVSGPTKGTNNTLPTFCWNATHEYNLEGYRNYNHLGQPVCWDFKPVKRKWAYVKYVYKDSYLTLF